jgi:hypothetical protein
VNKDLHAPHTHAHTHAHTHTHTHTHHTHHTHTSTHTHTRTHAHAHTHTHRLCFGRQELPCVRRPLLNMRRRCRCASYATTMTFVCDEFCV